MKEKDIKFFEPSESPYSVLVWRMTQAFFITEEMQNDIATPHRHDYYSLLFLNTGEINLIVDFHPVDLKASSMLLLRPGQVHQTIRGNNIDGWIILFDGKIINQNIKIAIEQSLQNSILLLIKKNELPGLIQLYGAINEALNEMRPGKFHKQFLQTLVNGLLYKTVDLLYLDEANDVAKHSSRAVEITRCFSQLVKENFRTLKRPGDYAEKLNITVSYLNDTLKAVTGFSSTYFIKQEIIGEAQRLLFYTAKTVKEIAFELGYQDYKYFIRQFGSLTHTTPLSFRKQTSVTSPPINSKPD